MKSRTPPAKGWGPSINPRIRLAPRLKLPLPAEYLKRLGMQPIGRGDWQSVTCPFHDDHHPSLRMHMQWGSYRCMTCGAKGGSVLAFHRQLRGIDFVEAAKELRTWT